MSEKISLDSSEKISIIFILDCDTKVWGQKAIWLLQQPKQMLICLMTQFST